MSNDKTACRELLAACRPFSRLTLGVRDVLVRHMHHRQFSRGEVLLRQGDPGDCLMIIAKGQASIRLCLPDGTTKTLGTVSKGHVVGEMALLTQEPRSTDVLAQSKVDAFVLAAETFDMLTAKHAEIGVLLTDVLTERLGTDQHDALSEKTLHGYRISECLGRGGMATVYAAVASAGQRPVALKMMHHRLVFDSTALERFQREASIAQSLEHPNIVAVDSIFSAYKTYFLVMEYCDGPTLGQLIHHYGSLDEQTTKRILGQLAQGLDYLHQRNLVHRDIKPSNVLLTSAGQLKLTDFGLTRQALAPKLTLEGVILGTPAYMAPEQIAGKDAGPSADVYALGCVAYEMLTGHTIVEAGDLMEMISKKLHWELPSRSAIRRGLSDDLYELLQLSLRKDPESRQLRLEQLAAWSEPLDPQLLADAQRKPSSDKSTLTVRR